MNETDSQKTECLLCHKFFWRITNTHLQDIHGTTTKQYRARFPSAILEDPAITFNRHRNIRGKTYEQIYGDERARELKEARSENATEQMKGDKQITIRQEKCGYEHTIEQIQRRLVTRKSNYIEKICPICEKVFMGDNGKKYCSESCGHKANFEKMVVGSCKVCGKLFDMMQYSKRMYCTRSCMSKDNGTRLSNVCTVCGAVYEVTKTRRDSKFCSPECYLTHKRQNGKGIGKARRLILKERGKICERCGATDNIVAHHIDGKGYQCEVGNHDLSNLMLLCKKCHMKLHKELEKTETLFKGQKDIENGMALILKGLKQQYNIDLTDKNYRDTPIRVARAYMEMLSGLKDSPEQLLSTKFTVEYDGMIVWKNIRFYSMCSHHFLPFEGYCNVVVLPADNQVVGLSKIARLVECFAKRPQLQEKMTHEIADSITKYLTPDCMVVTTATHMCMQCRGVEQEDSPVIVSSIRGRFEKIEVRTEALTLMNNGGKKI